MISSYSINFSHIGLDKNNLFNKYYYLNYQNKNELINFVFTNLDPNDRYILPYKKIISQDKKSFNKILKKYNLNQLILINIEKFNDENFYFVSIYKYFLNGYFEKITKIEYNLNNFNSIDNFFEKVTKDILLLLSDFWKLEYQINNNLINKIECKIIGKDYQELISIKSILNELSQTKLLKIKKIEMNINILEIDYYGDLYIFKKHLFSNQILLEDKNGCLILKK